MYRSLIEHPSVSLEQREQFAAGMQKFSEWKEMQEAYSKGFGFDINSEESQANGDI